MIKPILNFIISKFEAKHSYNSDYLREITDTSASASMRLMLLSGMTGYTGNKSPVWGGAALAGTLHGDCGPCAQLIVDQLIEMKFDTAELRACINSDWQAAGATGLGFRFAQAVLNNSDNVSQLRNEIVSNHGKEALTAAAFATTSYPVYPFLKRAMGYDQSCASIQFGDCVVATSIA